MSGMEELVETKVGELKKAEGREKVQEMENARSEVVQKQLVVLTKQNKILKQMIKLQTQRRTVKRKKIV